MFVEKNLNCTQSEEEEKPQFASLSPDQQLNSITFEEAMDLFKLPADLGEFEDKMITVNNGRYGPYVKHGDANNDSGFFIGESGLSINGVTYKPFVERIGLDFEDDKGYKYINAIYPHFDGEGTVNIYTGTEESQGAGITWSQPQEFVIGEDYKATFRESGRYIGIRIESKTDNIWGLTGYSIEYSYEGRQ